MKIKYLGNKDITYWYRNRSLGPCQGSAIWRSLKKVSQFFLKRLIWKLQSGNNILIGFDSILGVQTESPIPQQLLMSLHQKGLFYWAQVLQGWQGTIPIWKLAIDLGLNGTLIEIWNKVIWDMKHEGFYKIEENDGIVLQIKEGKSNILVKDIYISMNGNLIDASRRIFPKSFWKVGSPLKIILFASLVFHDRNLTWNNLQKKNWHGPAICSICLAKSEDNLHIFLNCHNTQILWNRLASHFGFSVTPHFSIMDTLQWWSSQKIEWRPIPLIVFWFVWKWRNKRIFENGKEDFGYLYDKIIPFYSKSFHIFPIKYNLSICRQQYSSPTLGHTSMEHQETTYLLEWWTGDEQ